MRGDADVAPSVSSLPRAVEGTITIHVIVHDCCGDWASVAFCDALTFPTCASARE